jgi:hypothetical protein
MVSPLAATPNPFRGVVINAERQPPDPDDLAASFYDAIVEWRETSYAVAWMDMLLEPAAHVPVATPRGFTCHHAQHSTRPDTVVLTA